LAFAEPKSGISCALIIPKQQSADTFSSPFHIHNSLGLQWDNYPYEIQPEYGERKGLKKHNGNFGKGFILTNITFS
jgi:hypothetical protein